MAERTKCNECTHIHLHVYDGKTKIVYRECEGYNIHIDRYNGEKIGYRFEISDQTEKPFHTIITSINTTKFFHIISEDEEFMRKNLESGEDVVVYRKK